MDDLKHQGLIYLFHLSCRYLERRGGKSESPESEDPHKQIMVTPDRIRSMIDITYTLKNADTFSKYIKITNSISKQWKHQFFKYLYEPKSVF